MMEMSEKDKKKADDEVRKFLSELTLGTAIYAYMKFEIGYIFDKNQLPEKIIGETENTLILRLNVPDRKFLCARLLYHKFASVILQHKPETDIADHIEPLNKLLNSHGIEVPYHEDRVIPDPLPYHHNNFISDLCAGTKKKIMDSRKKKGDLKKRFGIRGVDDITDPRFDDAFHYRLAEDLTEGGRYKLYDMTNLYAIDPSDKKMPRQGFKWIDDETSSFEFAETTYEIADQVKGSLDRVRELMTQHYDACNAIKSNLLRRNYKAAYFSRSNNHNTINNAINAMFSIRVDEDGSAELVLHDPGNLLLKRLDRRAFYSS